MPRWNLKNRSWATFQIFILCIHRARRCGLATEARSGGARKPRLGNAGLDPSTPLRFAQNDTLAEAAARGISPPRKGRFSQNDRPNREFGVIGSADFHTNYQKYGKNCHILPQANQKITTLHPKSTQKRAKKHIQSNKRQTKPRF